MLLSRTRFLPARRAGSAGIPFGIRAVGLAALFCALASGCARPASDRTDDGRVIVTYWEKWTGFEADAMQAVVNDFNASQDRIFVQMLSVSQIDQKMLLATAGGNPPDVAGLWPPQVNVYSEKNALTPLNRMIEEAGIRAEDYLPVYWEMCSHRGYQWALPSTPASLALHWNRALFREAGLDPDRPPRSIAELDAMAEKLTVVRVMRGGESVKIRFTELTDDERRNHAFTIVQMGFLPSDPGWWSTMWGYWFGASLLQDEKTVSCLTPENLEAFRWYRSYPEKYGLDNIRRLGSTFGNFASPQNPFLSGTLAMTLQGVWLYNFIDRFAPTLDWAAAPFPSVDPERWPNVTLAEGDVLVIPRGARHVAEAFEFIRYVNTQPVMEKLCMGHRKFSPLTQVSEAFLRDHPNRYVKVFADLAAGPNARTPPHTTVWAEYATELGVAADRIFTGVAEPEDALGQAQQRAQWKLDRVNRRWSQVGEARARQWGRIDDEG